LIAKVEKNSFTDDNTQQTSGFIKTLLFLRLYQAKKLIIKTP